MSEQKGYVSKEEKPKARLAKVYIYQEGNEYVFINPKHAFFEKVSQQYIVHEEGIIHRFTGTMYVKEIRVS